MADKNAKDKKLFDDSIGALKAEAANIGAHVNLDAEARLLYVKQIAAMSNELKAQVAMGKLTWSQAAVQAQQARNSIMEIIRTRNTPVGRAISERLKKEGRTLNELIARKVQQLFGDTAKFGELTAAEQNSVFSEIVIAAGKSDPKVTLTVAQLSKAGRGLIIISLALSVYTVATAENKGEAAIKEVTVTGAGIAGGMAGGALAGLACGPGAPVCVTVGAFVGGALAAFGVGSLW